MVHVNSVIAAIPLNMNDLMHASTEGDCQSRLKTKLNYVLSTRKLNIKPQVESKGIGKRLGYY